MFGKKMILFFFVLLNLNSFSQVRTENLNSFSNKKIKNLMEAKSYYWEILSNNDKKYYTFEFNKLSRKKGQFLTYIKDKIIETVKFKIIRKKSVIRIKFSSGKKKWISTLNYLNTFEMKIDNIKYNYVRFCY
jgi:hypothetical protein